MPNAMLDVMLYCAKRKTFAVKLQPKSEFSSKCNVHRIFNLYKNEANILKFPNVSLTLSLQYLWVMNMKPALTLFSGRKGQSSYKVLRWMLLI